MTLGVIAPLATHLLIQHAHFHARVPPVLFEDRRQRPALQLAPTTHDRARAVAAHVTTYEGRECARLQEERQGVNNQGLRWWWEWREMVWRERYKTWARTYGRE